MRGLARRKGSAYALLASMDPSQPILGARQQLMQRLVEVTGAGRAQLWQALPEHPDRLRLVQSFPPETGSAREVDLASIGRQADGVTLVLPWRGDEGRGPVLAALTLNVRCRTRRAHRELVDTANCLVVLHRRQTLLNQLGRQVGHTTQLAGEVLDSSRRLAGIRELERRRVAAEVAVFAQGRLAPLHAGVDRLARAPENAAELTQLRVELDRLVTDFRALARGIRPRVLYSKGLRAALSEVTAGHPGRVRITGTVPPRLDPEVVASLYYLAAAAVQAVSQAEADLDIVLEYRRLRVDALGVQMTLLVGLGGTLRPGQARVMMRAALAMDGDRLAAVGGWCEVAEEESGAHGRLQVVAWVPDRLEPPAQAALVPAGNLHARVRSQALRLVARYADADGSARARHLLSRLDEPVHVAVAGLPAPDLPHAGFTQTVRARPDLVLLVNNDLPRQRPRGALPAGVVDTPPDVIVGPVPGTPRTEYQILLPGVGPLRSGIPPERLSEALTTEVVARADLLRARTVLSTMQQLVQAFPPPPDQLGLLELELAELRHGAWELTELEALGRTGSGALVSPGDEAQDGGAAARGSAHLKPSSHGQDPAPHVGHAG
ncbi:hypothetical protein KIH74_12890 [Kineosporia sp. J2-2]|uniref:Uncharacterized protein n=1 Tax=Kineosporia corallincola TaxID=2835133 RepID=A0ABS5TI05_9ACTN|nr:hypothetical protein [Kineosporia corallincola]MBT0769826.1 hypothetical protein [Kineosporia corallincola]